VNAAASFGAVSFGAGDVRGLPHGGRGLLPGDMSQPAIGEEVSL
jgi:hypothetical protein